MGGDEEKRGGLDLSFVLPQKLIRTEEYPFRTASSTIDNTNYRTSPPNGSICGYEPFLLGNAEGAPPAAATRAFHPSLLSNSFRPSEARQDGSIAATMRYPLFTPTQWQELQRQALIYKHLVASVPVPISLLLDSGGFHATAQSIYPTMVGSCGRDSADPEPGRCRRTDGKKWRCTRDAAPDQKYCERHMHRGRPRSRKPVEHKNTTATSFTHSSNDLTAPAAETFAADSHANPPPRPEIKFPFSMAPEKETRYMDWMKGAVEGLQQPNSTAGLQSYNHDDDDQTGCFSTFINQEEISPLDQPRRFIDGWSVEGLSVPCVANQDAFCDRQTSSPGELSAFSLTLSMSGSGNDHRHVPQMGGPLGEVLRPSSSLQTRVVGNCGTEEGVSGARESPTAAAAAAAAVAACRGSGGSSSEFGLQWTSHAGRW